MFQKKTLDTNSEANLQPSMILKKLNFFEKNISVFQKNPNFERFIPTSVAFYSKFAII